jgi:hypothetical protein
MPMNALAIMRQLIEPGCQKNEKQQLFLPQSLHAFNRRSATCWNKGRQGIGHSKPQQDGRTL